MYNLICNILYVQHVLVILYNLIGIICTLFINYWYLLLQIVFSQNHKHEILMDFYLVLFRCKLIATRIMYINCCFLYGLIHGVICLKSLIILGTYSTRWKINDQILWKFSRVLTLKFICFVLSLFMNLNLLNRLCVTIRYWEQVGLSSDVVLMGKLVYQTWLIII